MGVTFTQLEVGWPELRMEFRGDEFHGVIFRGKNPLSVFGKAWHIEIFPSYDTDGLPDDHVCIFLTADELSEAKQQIISISKHYKTYVWALHHKRNSGFPQEEE